MRSCFPNYNSGGSSEVIRERILSSSNKRSFSADEPAVVYVTVYPMAHLLPFLLQLDVRVALVIRSCRVVRLLAHISECGPAILIEVLFVDSLPFVVMLRPSRAGTHVDSPGRPFAWVRSENPLCRS